VLRTAEASPTAVVAQETDWQEFPRLWGTLLDEVYVFARGGGTTQTGHNIMLFRDDVPNVEVGIQVDGPFEGSGRVIPSELPAGQVVSTVHRGSYDGLAGAHDAVHAWAAEQGHQLSRTRWEIYGDWHEDPNLMQTEVVWLVAPSS